MGNLSGSMTRLCFQTSQSRSSGMFVNHICMVAGADLIQMGLQGMIKLRLQLHTALCAVVRLAPAVSLPCLKAGIIKLRLRLHTPVCAFVRLAQAVSLPSLKESQESR